MTTDRIAQVNNVAFEKNGERIKLTMETESGGRLDLEFDKDTLQKYIADMTNLALQAAKVRTGGKLVALENQPPTHLDDIPVSDIGMAMTQSRKLALVLRLLDFDVSYTLDMQQLRSISDSFSQAVDALHADENSPH